MNEETFQVGAPGVDVAKLVAEIQASVAEKTRQGLYSDEWVARAERHNLLALRDDEEYLDFYLDCLRGATTVDIGDFRIQERRTAFAKPLVALKRMIWSLLRFYTYRLWSQQNQVNGLLLTAVDILDQRYRKRIAELESRLAKLEGRPEAAG
jgi:hypothetical protein